LRATDLRLPSSFPAVRWPLLASSLIVYGCFFFWPLLGIRGAFEAKGSSGALQVFELAAAAVSIRLLMKSNFRHASVVDLGACVALIALSVVGQAEVSLSLLAIYLIVVSRQDCYTRAAGLIAVAVCVQGIWAPLIFNYFGYLILPFDAALAGWLVHLWIPGASWTDTIITSPSGFAIEILPGCSSFHNVSLGTLCWVTITMLRRPYWTSKDIWVGLSAAMFQILCNISRLTIVAMDESKYQFFHNGPGYHFFAAAGAFAAVLIVAAGSAWASTDADPNLTPRPAGLDASLGGVFR
jgi:hypothetical protein